MKCFSILFATESMLGMQYSTNSYLFVNEHKCNFNVSFCVLWISVALVASPSNQSPFHLCPKFHWQWSHPSQWSRKVKAKSLFGTTYRSHIYFISFKNQNIQVILTMPIIAKSFPSPSISYQLKKTSVKSLSFSAWHLISQWSYFM